MRIVVVEDEEKTRQGIVRLLGKLSGAYRVVGECENGLDGEIVIRQELPDLVITDIRMPMMSGIDMLERLKLCGTIPRTIILSGYSEFEYARKALQIGSVIEYLLKPITVGDLKDALLKAEQDLTGRPEPDLPQDQTGTDSGQCHQSCSLVIHKSLKIIREQYQSGITLEELAHSCGITPEYLSSLFQKELGVSFTACLKEMRIKKAKQLLVGTRLKAFEVAERVGYPDAKYFSRVFKESTGLTPGEFQKLYR
ncbi:response regulator transcription factor [Paenibacillus hamazuiensis]|uniref:response regulator transcription factor n=1 Tax=Paenibacillus hamazuiensis TaxID=2936508 RepID=UPI0020102E73|nr:helix-turn-helix domain-containing protein [Paenibacillus hamazuiensis]